MSDAPPAGTTANAPEDTGPSGADLIAAVLDEPDTDNGTEAGEGGGVAADAETENVEATEASGGGGDMGVSSPPVASSAPDIDALIAHLTGGSQAPAAPTPTQAAPGQAAGGTPAGNQRDEFIRLMESDFGPDAGKAAESFKRGIVTEIDAKLEALRAMVEQTITPLVQSDAVLAQLPLNQHIDRALAAKDPGAEIVFGKGWIDATPEQRDARRTLETKANELLAAAQSANKRLSEVDAVRLVAAHMSKNPRTRAEVINRQAAGRSAQRTLPPSGGGRQQPSGGDILGADGKPDLRRSAVADIGRILNPR